MESANPTKGHRIIDDIAVSPDGKLLATGHHDGFVCLRDPATGAIRKEWQAHEAGSGDLGRVVRAGRNLARHVGRPDREGLGHAQGEHCSASLRGTLAWACRSVFFPS